MVDSGNHSVGFEKSPTLLSILIKIWATGVSLGLLIMFKSIFTKLKLIKKYGIKPKDRKLIVPVEENLQPFSFINLIFLNPARYDDASLGTLLLHEEAHIRHLHYIDLLWLEVFRLVFWFNPVSWILIRSIQENHEYLADRYVLDQGVESLNYYELILMHSDPYGITRLESSFSRFSTLKRLKMMKTTNKKKAYTRISALIFMFLLVFFSFGFINSEKNTQGDNTQFNDYIQNLITDPPSIHPVNPDKIKFTSGYGMRMHPIKKVEMLHRGIDIAAPAGTDVYATAEGTVIETGFKPEGPGNFIVLKHDSSYETFYSQLEKTLVNKGDNIKKGQVIGKVGSSGLSTGPHLHYEVRKDGEAIDPEPYLNKR
jgi:hypothetical protein